jgi:hypothetical protein
VTCEELALVLEAVPEQWQPFFTFLAHTGLLASPRRDLANVELGTHPHVKVRRQFYNGKLTS